MMDTELFAIQTKLKALGHDPGPIDGVWGPTTRHAVATALGVVTSSRVSPDTPWFSLARTQLGMKEIPGVMSNDRITEYFVGSVKRSHRDETPWCAAFVGWCMDETGYLGTKSLMARSYLEWGTKLAKPQRGCVVVFKRGAAPAGHVGFVDSFDTVTVMCLGGNQSNAVTVSRFPRSSVLGFRWPSQVAA